MNYLNKLYTFNCISDHFCVSFIINNNIENTDFILNVTIKSIDNKINDEYKTIKLNKNSNDVFRSNWINVQKEFIYKNYIIKKIKIMLKFRNDDISQVSSLYIKCFCPHNKKERNFAFNLSNISDIDHLDINTNTKND